MTPAQLVHNLNSFTYDTAIQLVVREVPHVAAGSNLGPWRRRGDVPIEETLYLELVNDLALAARDPRYVKMVVEISLVVSFEADPHIRSTRYDIGMRKIIYTQDWLNQHEPEHARR